jgi:peptidyl-prolyl cis-trans isomerase C
MINVKTASSSKTLRTYAGILFVVSSAAALGDQSIPPMAPGAKQVDVELARFGDANITLLDFDAAMQAIPERDRFEFRRQPKRIVGKLEGLLINRSLAGDARTLGLDRDPLVQRRIVLATEELLASVRLDAFRRSITLPDFEKAASEEYTANPDQYRREGKIRASHVLISLKSRSEEEAMQRAEMVRGKLLAGESIKPLAAEFSDDPSAKRNLGDLGFFGKGRMVKEFEAAAFALRAAGEISPVVKTQFGYHVIQLAEREEERTIQFSEVRESLIKRFESGYIDRAVEEYIAKIRANPAIKLNTEAIDSLQTKSLKP